MPRAPLLAEGVSEIRQGRALLFCVLVYLTPARR